jgi:hypothetical protein
LIANKELSGGDLFTKLAAPSAKTGVHRSPQLHGVFALIEDWPEMAN